MGKLTTDVFNESCCDGGQHTNSESAQPCGCDPKARWMCARHSREQGELSQKVNTWVHPCQPIYPDHPSPLSEAGRRKQYPITTGCFDYFPDALLEVAHVSWVGNEQHNPGQPLHWDRSKSMDEADALVRHLLARGTRDTDGMRHSAKTAWRALALLQKEIEADR